MAEAKEARVPDIGDFGGVPVIEVLIKAGDTVEKDQSLITLESEKATMEVPAPFAGKVTEVKVSEGDEVAEGAVIALIEAEGDSDADASSESKGDQSSGDADAADKGSEASDKGAGKKKTDSTKDKKSSGEDVGEEEPGSDKDGKSASEDDDTQASADDGNDEDDESPTHPPSQPVPRREDDDAHTDAGGPHTPPIPFDASLVMPGDAPYASPAVRAFARELGVDISQVKGSGRKRRIQREDVQAWVKHALATGARPISGGGVNGLDLLPWPKVDFAKYGEIEEQPRSRIKKISGANLARNWAMIPHVTQHDDADITEMEAFRKKLGEENKDLKLTPLVFLIKAVVAALKEYPQFNASLDAGGEKLILKKYFHIGIAVDTPDGLVVPVIRDCDKKGLLDLARELGGISKKARDKKLGPSEMSGGCFSISSLGGIGGTSFTPIVNAPEVAILGVSRSAMKPRWDGKEFKPRLILPLSLSYDHRVVDGAAAARFAAFLAKALGDIRRLLL